MNKPTLCEHPTALTRSHCIRNSRFPILLLTVVLFISACGGGGGGNAGAPLPGTVIGAAGGTVSGPNGAQVVIPPGALATDTTINIEQTAAGAPALPSGFTTFGQMFAFTPHGTTFAVPVTMTLPFDPASVPAGQPPQFYKTNAQNQWEQVATATFSAVSVSAQVTSFSSGTVVIPPLVRGDPIREWSFNEYRGDALEEVEVDADIQVGGLFHELHDFGPAVRDIDIISPDGISLPPDGIATGQISSSADGVTYWVGTDAPIGVAAIPNDPIGSISHLTQTQSFIKRASDASLSFTLSAAFIQVSDFNGVLGRQCPPVHVHEDGLLCDLIKGEVWLQVEAFTVSPALDFNTFFHLAGGATLNGFAGSWNSGASTARFSRTPLWTVEDFDFVIENDLHGFPEGFVLMILRNPHTYTVDLSSIEVGQAFTVQVFASTRTYNRAAHSVSGIGSEFETSASAFLRDPQGIGGTSLTFTGLEPTDTPLTALEPRVEVPVLPAPCIPGPGPDPAAGVLQFSAASYTLAEANTTPTITVTRTGGSVGAVTATFTTSDGSAIAGTDYTPVNASVFFADGDAAPRVAEVPIIQDLLSGEPDKTVNLTLSQPGGCAALGPQTTAVLTIRDDDPLPLLSFTVGGTVSGLIGSGLVLQDLNFLPITPGNGPFTFSLPTNSGSPYAVTVVTQPTNPLQICTVTNGSGTVGNANITNVAVDCATPSTNGSLDASFASGGKLTTPSTGIGNAVALQPADDKIVTVGGAFTLTRHNVNGSIDTSFGTAGKVTTLFGGGLGTASDVAIQADGKIVVAGSTRARAGFSDDDDFAVRRYNAEDGSLDTSFGTGGIVSTDFTGLSDIAHAVAIQSDGKIVVAGQARSPLGTDLALARYNTDGSLDSSFGSGGKLSSGLAEISVAMALQPDGRIIVLGKGREPGSVFIDVPVLIRYASDGSLDASFGIGGRVNGVRNGPSDALALQADGKIIVAGSVNAGSSSSAFALTRFHADGSVDSVFGSPTTSFFPSGSGGSGSIGRAVAVQADGKIVLAGQAASGASSTFDVAIACYDTNGNLDTAFGVSGKLLVDFFGNTDSALDVVVQADGKIVVAGLARNGFSTEFALVRINP